jgi:hypothetical protein
VQVEGQEGTFHMCSMYRKAKSDDVSIDSLRLTTRRTWDLLQEWNIDSCFSKVIAEIIIEWAIKPLKHRRKALYSPDTVFFAEFCQCLFASTLTTLLLCNGTEGLNHTSINIRALSKHIIILQNHIQLLAIKVALGEVN